MGQEFVIKSQKIEDKINQLLPSQGGYQPGVDLSASTTVIPIVDLTETAEGSDVRPDLQTALSLNSVSVFSISNTTTTVINTTGYYRIFGVAMFQGAATINFRLTDGITTKLIKGYTVGTTTALVEPFDFVCFFEPGS